MENEVSDIPRICESIKKRLLELFPDGMHVDWEAWNYDLNADKKIGNEPYYAYTAMFKLSESMHASLHNIHFFKRFLFSDINHYMEHHGLSEEDYVNVAVYYIITHIPDVCSEYAKECILTDEAEKHIKGEHDNG